MSKRSPRLTPPPPNKGDGDDGLFHSVGFESPAMNAIIGLTRIGLDLPTQWKLVERGRPDHAEKLAPPLNPAALVNYGTGAVGETPNHKIQWCAWFWLWAMEHGTPQQRCDAERYVVDFFNAMFGEINSFTPESGAGGGLYMSEAQTTSHYAHWWNAIGGVRLGAFRYKNAAILDCTGRFFRMDARLYDLQRRGDHIYTPNARPDDLTPSNVEQRDVISALIDGRPMPRKLKNGRPIPAGWFDSIYNFGAWSVQWLLDKKDDLGGAAKGKREEPILRDPLYIYTRGDDFVSRFPHATKFGPHLLWEVDWIDGQLTESAVTRGDVVNKDCPFELPVDVAGWDAEIVPGVNMEET